jgi:ABC-type spermidine/putrescine transport system permease subunit I
MAITERIYKHTDKPMSWTRAILIGLFIWVLVIAFLGQLPSLIIYKADTYVSQIIEFTKKIPGVGDAGLNTIQIKIVRDIIANSVQMGLLVAALVFAYIWQERKRKRTGGKGVTDVVKGYMPGK